MPKIPMPKRRITPSGRAGVERIPAYPQPSRRVGYETQRLGQTLRGIGGTLGQLAGKLQELQYDNDMLTGKNTLAKDYKTYVDTEVSKDDDYAGREGKFYTWFDSATKEHITTLKSERAKRDLKKWHPSQRLKMGIQISAQAHLLLVQDTRIKSETWLASTEEAWANAPTEEDRKRIEDETEEHFKKLDADDIYIDGWIEQREIDFLINAKDLAYKKLKKDAYDQTYDILVQTGDAKLATEFLGNKKNFPGLLSRDRYNLIRYILEDEKYMKEQLARADEARDMEETDDLVKLLAGRDLKGAADRIAQIEDSFKKREWEKTLSGSVKPVKKTNNEAYLDLQDIVLKYWLREPLEEGKPALTRDQMQTRLAEARGVAKSVTDEDFNVLLSFMDDPLSKDLVSAGNLKAGFDAIKGQTTGWLDWAMSAEEARAVVAARIELLSWMQSEKAKKKTPKLEEVLETALGFYAASLKSPRPSFYPFGGGLVESKKEPTEPKTKTEFINTLRRFNETDTEKAKEYYNKYLDKFW